MCAQTILEDLLTIRADRVLDGFDFLTSNKQQQADRGVLEDYFPFWGVLVTITYMSFGKSRAPFGFPLAWELV